jgi:hypothetical protein
MRNKFKGKFGTFPLIGMVHLLALPGSPNYGGSIETIVQSAKDNMKVLIRGGANAIIIENFGDTPYGGRINRVAFAVMNSICTILQEGCDLPLGINVQFNDIESEWAMAFATHADFIRVEAFVENRIGIHGVSYASAPRLMRLKSLYPSDTMIFADINVKHTYPLVNQPVESSVHEAIEAGADALIVTGLQTGQNPSVQEVRSIKEFTRGIIPVIVGSGINNKNIAEYLAVSDGVIAGSSIKYDGKVQNCVDQERVKALAEKLRR